MYFCLSSTQKTSQEAKHNEVKNMKTSIIANTEPILFVNLGERPKIDKFANGATQEHAMKRDKAI